MNRRLPGDGGTVGVRRPRPPPHSRPGLVARLSTSLAALLMGTVLLAVPITAVPAGASIVLKAPYKGTTVNLSSSVTKTGCSKLIQVVPPAFHPKLGLGTFGGSVAAPPCRTIYGNAAAVYPEFDVYVPIKAAPGAHTIVANWTFIVSGKENLTRGHCAPSSASQYDCFQSSFVFVNASVGLLDVTNFSTNTVLPSNNWSGISFVSRDDTDCPTGIGHGCVNKSAGANASFSLTAQFSWWINATLLSGHHYLLFLGIFGGVVATLEYFNTVLTGGHASASLNMASLGHRATLNSVRIS